MPDDPRNVDLAQAARFLLDAQRPLLVTHAKPDGDAFGSVVALAASLRHLGHPATGWLIPPVPRAFDALPGRKLTHDHRDGQPCPVQDPDALVILDTASWSQLAPLRPALEPLLDRALILDHHVTRDVPAKLLHADTSAAACCEIVGDLIRLLDLATGHDSLAVPAVRDGLFVGIASDTGWFRHSNTTPRTHDWAAALLRAGVDHDALHQTLEQSDRPERLALLVRALAGLKLLSGDRAAVMVLTESDFLDTGASLEETERIIDIPRTVESVQVVALITQPPADRRSQTNPRPQPIRVSFRSKAGPAAVDVAALASRWGGGGHVRAAGAKVQASLEDVVREVTQALVAAVDRRA